MDDSNMGVRPPIFESLSRDFEVDEAGHVKSKHGLWTWPQRFRHKLFGKEDHPQGTRLQSTPNPSHESLCRSSYAPQRSESLKLPVRSVGVGLPRQATFRRQNSERRERLLPVLPCPTERRAVSSARPTSFSTFRRRSQSSPPPSNPATSSAPAIPQRSVLDGAPRQNQDFSRFEDIEREPEPEATDEQDRPPRPLSTTSSNNSFHEKIFDAEEQAQLNAELDSKWILNLSMHFRDKSDREKFFVTYAQRPNRWRRVTVSCDYRNAEPGSLEMDLKELQYQRDKSMQIYDSIRDSLLDIQFYDTVTNLKLETSEGRLHVHVTEDVNEIIPYPSRTTVRHVLDTSPRPPMEVRECDLEFDSHLSGFVYKVRYGGKDYIKKEIPGPDTVDEFLYEVNALHDLNDSEHVVQLEAIVVDDLRQSVKGLLISYAERGALVDILYDHKGEIPWEDRMKWARQAVQGLGEIHEEGYVQGDFTLSNIVVDSNNDAKIIDINRRGCPVGWEPPEIAKKIASNQRISMYIGEKSDIYQLGMTLWALAMDDDEPERHDPPLSVSEFPSEVPEWYREVVRICLAPQPRHRLSATQLVLHFPPSSRTSRPPLETRPSLSVRTEKQYIDPATAVDRDDIEQHVRNPSEVEHLAWTPASSRNDPSYTYPRSSSYEQESGSSYFERPRGRSRPRHSIPGDGEEIYARVTDEENISPLDNDDRQIHIVSPLGDQEYYDYVDGRQSLTEFPPPESEPGNLSTGETAPSVDKDTTSSDYHLEYISAHPPSKNQELDDIELCPPRRAKSDSTSESTPRNAQSFLEGSTSTLTTAPPLDVVTSELAGLGKHPSLEEHSPHEPRSAKVPIDEESPDLAPPPKFSFSDSGFNEPVDILDSNNDTTQDNSKHDEEVIQGPDSDDQSLGLPADELTKYHHTPSLMKINDSHENFTAITPTDSAQAPRSE